LVHRPGGMIARSAFDRLAQALATMPQLDLAGARPIWRGVDQWLGQRLDQCLGQRLDQWLGQWSAMVWGWLHGLSWSITANEREPNPQPRGKRRSCHVGPRLMLGRPSTAEVGLPRPFLAHPRQAASSEILVEKVRPRVPSAPSRRDRRWYDARRDWICG
jgi:hypothetical protein